MRALFSAQRIAALLVLAACLFTGFRRVGSVPPLGGLLDPVRGVWAVASRAVLPAHAEASVPGLHAPVHVLYDARGVPHIFARSEADAYRALGYVVARDRLFQLELQTRAADGTLTELLGPGALPLDRDTRALGLPRAAAAKLAALAGTRALQVITAYADGVNAYIDAMGARDVPLEYRLLGRRPARWRPVNSIHLLDRMGLTLAFDNIERRRLRAAALVGDRAARALFPVNSPIQEPIQPNGDLAPRMDTTPLPPPGVSDTTAAREVALANLLQRVTTSLGAPDRSDVVGSNNWAVSPRRTRDGAALLAGDPHLELTLPSIWYEAHVVVPDSMDVYGVTIPGAAGIVIGFTPDIAWTFTNTGADVLDFYAESVDVASRPTRYFVDGAWHPVGQDVERYRDGDGHIMAIDTVCFTARGPLRRVGGRWLSMRWTVLDPETPVGDFVAVAHARTADDFLHAMHDFGAPAQNMLVADRAGTIAIRSTGRFPLRPGNGRGDEIRDGTSSRSDWTGYWPAAKYPFARDPARGFLASANQQPVDPRVDSTYLGADWPAPWRAMRIDALLRADSQVTVDDMRRFQTDPGSARADLFVPYFLAAARAHAASGDTVLARAATLLAQWDRRYTMDNTRAVLFELAMRELQRRLWDELEPDSTTGPAVTPSDAMIAELLTQPASAWWDDRRTRSVVETRDDIVAASLRAALVDARRRYGAPDAGGWTWSRIRQANIYHLLHLPSLSRLGIAVQGGPGTLNPSSGAGNFGPSWRMVVALGAVVRGWGTFPGGESGNPASARYDNLLPRWRTGALDSLIVPRDTTAMRRAGVTAELILVPGTR